jgi:hypothetical protein
MQCCHQPPPNTDLRAPTLPACLHSDIILPNPHPKIPQKKTNGTTKSKPLSTSTSCLSLSRLIQISHLIIHNPLQSPLRPTVHRRPLPRPLPQLLGFRQSLRQLRQPPVHDVFLLGQRFRELDLVVVEQGFVGDDDQGDGDAEGVEDGAGACVCVESVSE